MILVTLGTQDKQFYRLLDYIQELIDNKIITEEVIVQAGYSKNYKSKSMKIFDLLPMDEFDNLIKNCNVLITHGGVGSIIAGLKCNKKVIAVPRLKKYGEHTNDHQLQIINNFSEEGYILPLYEDSNLQEIFKKVKKFKPKKYVSNNSKIVKLIDDEINKYLN